MLSETEEELITHLDRLFLHLKSICSAKFGKDTCYEVTL